MKFKNIYLQWAIYFGVALICQLLFRDFPTDFFAFPVNAACILLGCVSLWILFKEKPHSRLSVLLSAPQTTYLLLGILFVSCLTLGFGVGPATNSWWFVLLLLALTGHLLYTIYRRMLIHRFRTRFLLVHVGLFLALLGGFAGSADTEEWRMVVRSDAPGREAFNKKGEKKILSRPFRLKSFKAEYYPDGMPQDFEAIVDINDKEATIKVNHPHSLSLTDDLYLVDYEHVAKDHQPKYCILQIVRQPWKYLQWIGIWMLISGCMLLFIQGVPNTGNDKKK